jgi:phage tail-like protein
MAETDDRVEPYVAFNFSVEITDGRVAPDGTPKPLCEAAFSECDGLEMTMEVKTIKEGGANGQLIRLTGPVGYGQLTLKRGMTANFDLWDWFRRVIADPGLRLNAEVVMYAKNRTVCTRFLLRRCVPVKLKAPALNAKDGMVAIEEMQLAYESISYKAPSPPPKPAPTP